ncbi:MAG TPA: cobalamin-dependent protein [bacterium]|nr:cobalamin-dependent protein [bacterium]
MVEKRKIEKVLLIFPPVRQYRETLKIAFSPLGISYVAAMLRDDCEVRLLDAAAEGFPREEILDENFIRYGLPLQEIRARIEQFAPDVVGVTCLFSSLFPMVREICREVKRIDPRILTITGGTYPTFMAEHCLSEPSLDMIALSEGEVTMREIVRALREGRPLGEVDGLAYKEDGRVVIHEKTQWVMDLDSLPFPARDLMPMELYKKIAVPHGISVASTNNAPMITSRGCPAHCFFCSSTKFWGNRFRFRSPANVLDEIGELIEKYGIDEIQFEDDNITADRKRAKEIFRGIIERGYKVKLNLPNGVALWTLDEELVDLIIEAGAYEMTLAFESGCQEVLSKIIKKPLNLEKARAITGYIRKKKLRTNAYYIFGFPGETIEQMRETFRFAKEMNTDTAYFFVANPLPGTEMYEMAKARGMLPPDFNFENLAFTRSPYHEGVFPAGKLERMAAREFLKYNLRSYLRHPLVLLKKSVVDMMLKRPRWTLSLLIRIIRRNFI